MTPNNNGNNQSDGSPSQWDRLDDFALHAEIDGYRIAPWQLTLLRQMLTARGVIQS